MGFRKPAWVTRAQQKLRSVTDLFPVTGLGLLLGGLALAAWFLWVDGGQDFVIRAVVVTLAIAILICIFTTLIGALVVFRSARVPKVPIIGDWETGELRKTGFITPRLSNWPFVQVHIRWAQPSGVHIQLKRSATGWEESVRCSERGRLTQIDRRITIRDIFGFSAITLKHRQSASIRVAPTASPLSLSPDLRTSDGDGSSNPLGEPVGDFVEMRRYAPGDPLRMILWKAFARSRRLLVRTPERAIAPMPSAAAYFVCGQDDEDSAAMARTVVESGLLGDDLVFGADGVPELAHTPQGAVDAIIDSVHHRHRAGVDFAQFVRRIDPAKLGQCVLFLPSKPGPWIQEIESEIQRLPKLPMLLVAVDGPASIATSKQTRRFFRATVSEDRMRGIPELYSALRTLGSTVRIIHRGEGRPLTTPEIDALEIS